MSRSERFFETLTYRGDKRIGSTDGVTLYYFAHHNRTLVLGINDTGEEIGWLKTKSGYQWVRTPEKMMHLLKLKLFPLV